MLGPCRCAAPWAGASPRTTAAPSLPLMLSILSPPCNPWLELPCLPYRHALAVARLPAASQRPAEFCRFANAATPTQVQELDLSSLQSVRRFAEGWRAACRPLHALVNNAGIFAMSAVRHCP